MSETWGRVDVLAEVSQKADPMANGHDLDPETGEGICASTGKQIEAETMGDLTDDCPHCGDPLSVLSEKADGEPGYGVDVFRVLADPGDDTEYDGDVLGIGVDFPESGVYVDWRLEAFPDPLEDPHVSIYGSIEDLEEATQNVIEYVERYQTAVDVGEAESAGAADGKLESHAVPVDRVADAAQGKTVQFDGEDLYFKLKAPADTKEWQQYTTESGSTAWYNPATGERRYQEEKPGQDGAEGERQEGSNGGDGDGDGEDGGEVSHEEVSETVSDVTEEFLNAGLRPKPEDASDLNNGFCNAVANEIFEELGEPDGMRIMEAETMGGRHQWVEFNGQHFDAEAPEGVDDYEDLPVWNRFGRPGDARVVEEGGDGDDEDDGVEVAGETLTEGEEIEAQIEESGSVTGTVDEIVEVNGSPWVSIESEEGRLSHYPVEDIEDWEAAPDEKLLAEHAYDLLQDESSAE